MPKLYDVIVAIKPSQEGGKTYWHTIGSVIRTSGGKNYMNLNSIPFSWDGHGLLVEPKRYGQGAAGGDAIPSGDTIESGDPVTEVPF